MNISQEEFNKKKWNDLIPFNCPTCGKEFHRVKHSVTPKTLLTIKFCSKKCKRGKNPRISLVCSNCQKPFERRPSELLRHNSEHNFCSQSCSSIYYHAHNKKTGCRRSKLEEWIQNQLTSLYPNLPILYNDKTTINSELDIYIPSLKLAVELNGIFHYEPIFGQDKLNKIQNNDSRKFQACLDKEISLCIIDSSKFRYFKLSKAQEFLDIIAKIIDSKLNEG